jgi:SAM-dependent methyltransferase
VAALVAALVEDEARVEDSVAPLQRGQDVLGPAICGTRPGCTKLTSMPGRPVAASRFTSSARTAGSSTSGSFWSPSRGPTSHRVTRKATASVSVKLESFVLSHVPRAPARVLEVGCGRGDLARALAAAGHEVTAVDPEAPGGPLFRRVTLEDFGEPGPFDAVVASRSLHHVPDLAVALDKIAALLRPGGVLVLNEFAKERLEGPTAEWYYERRRALAAAGGNDAPRSFNACLRDEHADIHGFGEMRRELDRRFAERLLAWVPYLHAELEDVASEELERELIEAGAIRATGVRYVGESAAS